MFDFFNGLWENFYKCFIEYDIWKMYLQGLRNTVIIAVGACLLGLLIGIIVTCIRVAPKSNPVMKFLDAIARLYVTVIRGTPVVLQLFICYFVLLTSIRNTNFLGIKDTAGILVAIVTFGINSGAYVSEIIRAGILSIDKGQTEAGRSLGLSSSQTMISIVIPQAVKNIFPALCNEFIVLIKETAIVGYVGLVDIQKAGDFIKSATFEAFMPLLATAVIYFVLIKILTLAMARVEAALRKSEIR